MVNKNKQKGTSKETEVRKYLNSNGIKAKRKVLHGSNDQGDLECFMLNGTELTLEVKSGNVTLDYCRSMKEGWLKETRDEQENSGCPAYLIVAKKYRNPKDYEVWSCDGHTFWYLDQFVEALKIKPIGDKLDG